MDPLYQNLLSCYDGEGIHFSEYRLQSLKDTIKLMHKRLDHLLKINKIDAKIYDHESKLLKLLLKTSRTSKFKRYDIDNARPNETNFWQTLGTPPPQPKTSPTPSRKNSVEDPYPIEIYDNDRVNFMSRNTGPYPEPTFFQMLKEADDMLLPQTGIPYNAQYYTSDDTNLEDSFAEKLQRFRSAPPAQMVMIGCFDKFDQFYNIFTRPVDKMSIPNDQASIYKIDFNAAALKLRDHSNYLSVIDRDIREHPENWVLDTPMSAPIGQGGEHIDLLNTPLTLGDVQDVIQGFGAVLGAKDSLLSYLASSHPEPRDKTSLWTDIDLLVGHFIDMNTNRQTLDFTGDGILTSWSTLKYGPNNPLWLGDLEYTNYDLDKITMKRKHHLIIAGHESIAARIQAKYLETHKTEIIEYKNPDDKSDGCYHAYYHNDKLILPPLVQNQTRNLMTSNSMYDDYLRDKTDMNGMAWHAFYGESDIGAVALHAFLCACASDPFQTFMAKLMVEAIGSCPPATSAIMLAIAAYPFWEWPQIKRNETPSSLDWEEIKKEVLNTLTISNPLPLIYSGVGRIYRNSLLSSLPNYTTTDTNNSREPKIVIKIPDICYDGTLFTSFEVFAKLLATNILTWKPWMEELDDQHHYINFITGGGDSDRGSPNEWKKFKTCSDYIMHHIIKIYRQIYTAPPDALTLSLAFCLCYTVFQGADYKNILPWFGVETIFSVLTDISISSQTVAEIQVEYIPILDLSISFSEQWTHIWEFLTKTEVRDYLHDKLLSVEVP
jgi:hypothetical protein